MRQKTLLLVLGLIIFLPLMNLASAYSIRIGALDPAGGRNEIWINKNDKNEEKNLIGWLQQTNDIIDPQTGEKLVENVIVTYKVIKEERKYGHYVAVVIRMYATQVRKGHLNLEIAGEGYSVTTKDYEGKFLTTYVYISSKEYDD